MFYKKRKKGGIYHFFRFLRLVLIVVLLVFAVDKLINKEINPEDIYQNSVLKNKKMDVRVKEIEYKNIKAYLFEEHSNPIIAVHFLFRRTGYAYDENGKFGLSSLVAKMLINGAGEYDETQFADVLEENGIRLGFTVDADDLKGYMGATTENFDIAVNLLKKVLYEINPNENSLSLQKEKHLLALQQQKDHPHGELELLFIEKIYENHPYSRNPIGNAEDIKNIKIEDIKQFVKDNFTADRLIIGISGDIDEDGAVKVLEDVFAPLPAQGLPEAIEKFDVKNDGTVFNAERESPQIITKIAAKGIYREDKDFYPLYMANYILGYGLTSRLSKKIREEKGLTYGVYTYLTMRDSSALIEGGFSAAPENAGQAIKLFNDEWKNMGKNGVNFEELEYAKKSLIASFNLRFADIGSIASMLVSMQKYNLGLDFLVNRNEYIKNISLKEVNEVAHKYYGVMPDIVTIGIKKKDKQ